MVNPGSVILSGVMMLRYLGWNEAADLIEGGLERTIRQKKVTYDLARQMEGATELKTSEFADAVIQNYVGRRPIDCSYEPKSHSRWGRRQRRRHGGAGDRRQGTGRRRHHRHRRSEGGRRRRSTCSRPARSKGPTRASSGTAPMTKLGADGQLRRRRHHVRRAAQAGHEPRRPAEGQLQDHAVGDGAGRQVLAELHHRPGRQSARRDVPGRLSAERVPARAGDRHGRRARLGAHARRSSRWS